MKKIILVYGGIAGGVIIGTTLAGMALVDTESMAELEWLGYLVMILALSLVFVGMKQYRDQELGGVIRYGTAVRVGLGIVLVASVVYVAVWEVSLAATDYAFMEEYAESTLERRRVEGASPAELEEAREELAVMQARYDRTPFRLMITFLEIFPVGLVVTLVSAAFVRRSEVLPAA